MPRRVLVQVDDVEARIARALRALDVAPVRSPAALAGQVRAGADAHRRARGRRIVGAVSLAVALFAQVGPGVPDRFVPVEVRSPAAEAATPTVDTDDE